MNSNKVEFHPAFDTPKNAEQALACLGAWSDGGCYTFCHKRAKVMHELLKAALTTQQAQNTAPLNGGIRQMAEPSDSDVRNSTSRVSLPNNCESGVQKAVDRFLSWPLPDDFNPDGGITYTPVAKHKPTGTNLLTAAQAEAMVRHILAAQESWDEQRAKAEFSSHDESPFTANKD